jgi:hypothetical protein
LAVTSPPTAVKTGRFLCLEIVVSRDGSYFKPDPVAAKPD